MAVTERIIARLIQPLLKAQWEKGFEEGIQLGIQESIDKGFEHGKKISSEAWQEWIRRQIEAGAQLRDDIPPSQP